MNKEVQFGRFFRFTSKVTDFNAAAGARILDVFLINLLGNNILLNSFQLNAKHKISKIKHHKRFLVVADLNIGDALISSCGVTALRKIFPDAEIDFAVKKSTKNLFEGNSEVSNLYPVYNSAPFPTENDLARLLNILNKKDYDLIINYSPMIPGKIFGNRAVINYTLMAAQLIKNEGISASINNINFSAYNFIGNLFRDYIPQDFQDEFKGANIYLSDNAIDEAEKFFTINGISVDKPIIMFNPDASAVYTRMPFDFQIELLKKLNKLDCTILIGAGHVEKFIEDRIMEYFSRNDGQNIFVIPPSTELNAYAAIIDRSDIFITGDTGPLHIAAARKFSSSSGKSLRNKTAVYSIFGSTPPKIYGYDSKLKNYIPANQDAPSKVFIAQTPCRNISCINKMSKACKEVRCFDSLSTDEIVSEAVFYMESIKRFHLPSRRGIFAR